MFKQQKNSIDNYYIGELYMSYSFGNLLATDSLSVSQRIEREKINSLTFGGAIDFEKGLLNKYTDFKNRRNYEGLLTIFYKYNGNYICLHDGEIYSFNGDNFYKNLVPMKELLPKVEFEMKEQLTHKEALKLFDMLFKKKNTKISINNKKEQYLLSDFYVGKLELYTGFHENSKNKKIYRYSNLPQKHLLYNSEAKISCFYGVYGQPKKSNKDESDIYDYASFTCLFLKQKEGFLNLNNNQIYEELFKNKDENTHYIAGDSYCKYVSTFSEYLQNKQISYSGDKIEIEKSLKLFKKS